MQKPVVLIADRFSFSEYQNKGIEMNKLVRAKFRVKIKSLAEEARIIRHEERRMKGQNNDGYRGELRYHRISVVRDEQRATLLAYALLRGVPYSALEAKARPVDTKAVMRIAQSLARTAVDVDAWVGARAAA